MTTVPTLTPERILHRLEWTVIRRLDGQLQGANRTLFRGSGTDFRDLREYEPGDDVRHIDWNVTARTGDPHIKVFREERQVTVLLVVDVSGSTRVGAGGRDGRTDRRLQIARVAGGLAYASMRNQDRVGLVTFTDRIESVLVPRRTRGHTWAVIQAVYAGHAAGRGTDLQAALGFVRGIQRRRAVVVVVSDFLDDHPWERTMGSLARRHKVHAVCVHDPLDASFAGLGLIDVVDAETGRTMTVDGRAFAARTSIDERIARLRRAGARTIPLSTTEDPFAVLLAHFQREGARR